MRYTLTHPCENCPFRSDTLFCGLGEARKKEIARSLLDLQQTFPCHKTVDYEGDKPEVLDDSQHCAGALILLEKLEKPNQMMRIAERLHLYDRRKLNLESPVFDSFEEWINA
jgi:hypothetical protein